MEVVGEKRFAPGIDAHDRYLSRLCTVFKRLGDVAARFRLAVFRDGIFEIERDGIGSRFPCLFEQFGTGTRYEELASH